MNEIIISGIGCALVDQIFSDIGFQSPEFLKYTSVERGDGGLSPGKLVFIEELEKFSDLGYDKIQPELTAGKPPVSKNLGGPGLVSLIHVSQILEPADYKVRFFGIAGDDYNADLVFKLLQNSNLDITNYLSMEGRSTPFTDVYSDPEFKAGEGERAFVNSIGAAWDFSPSLISKDFFHSDMVCFGGTALLPPIHDHLHTLLSKAKANGCLTIVYTVYDFRSEKNAPGEKWSLGEYQASLRLIDLLIMDKEEALRISGENNLENASDYFIQGGVSSMVITNGANDLVAYSDGRFFIQKGFFKLPVSEKVARDLKTKFLRKGDTTGCGDNFAGGMIASVAEQLKNSQAGDLNLFEALKWAVVSGGFACFYYGGTYHEKTVKEKFNLLKDYYDAYQSQIQL